MFDLETVKEALRAKAWQYFPRQIFLVNACANEPPGHCNKQQFKDLDSEGHLNRKQFTICAASPGQRAYDYSPLPLVSTIQKAISRQGRLDLREYCERICETAESLRQTPRIEWVDWNGSRDGWSGDALVRFLHQKLKKCRGVDFTEHLKPLYRQCVEKVENVQSIWEIVSHLEAEKSQAITRYGPVLDFVLHVIHCYNSADSVSQLDRELTTLFEQEPEYDLPLLATARGEIEKKYRQPVGPLYLSIVPGEHGDSFWFYLHDSTGWRIINEDIRIAADETLEAAFQRAILEREAKLMGFELHFHFFLRIEKLNLDLHEWQDPTLPGEEEHLEKNHYVAVRCWERAKGTDPGWGFALDRWRRKTRILKTRPFQARPRINWVAEPDGCDWEGSIEAHECVGFHQPPVNKWLRSAMLKGLPFLIWPRQSVENWKICREKLDAIELHGGWHWHAGSFPAYPPPASGGAVCCFVGRPRSQPVCRRNEGARPCAFRRPRITLRGEIMPTNDWKLYRGDPAPDERLREILYDDRYCPQWRNFPRLHYEITGKDDPKIKKFVPAPDETDDRGAVFVPDAEMIDLVNAALYLRRPLLITGPPGVGKSSLIYSVARELKLGRVLRWPVTSRTSLRDGQYHYDAIGRLQEWQLKKMQPKSGRREIELDIGEYLTLGPLGTAMLPWAHPRALLIDEIDKGDPDLANDMLNVLEEGEFEIPELVRLGKKPKSAEISIPTADGGDHQATIVKGRVRCLHFPFVILTSNGERDFPPAFMRRCLHLQVAEPNEEALWPIVQAHLGDAVAQEADKIIQTFVRLRSEGLRTNDQLLQAVFLLTRDYSMTDEAYKEALRDKLLASLTKH